MTVVAVELVVAVAVHCRVSGCDSSRAAVAVAKAVAVSAIGTASSSRSSSIGGRAAAVVVIGAHPPLWFGVAGEVV